MYIVLLFGTMCEKKTKILAGRRLQKTNADKRVHNILVIYITIYYTHTIEYRTAFQTNSIAFFRKPYISQVIGYNLNGRPRPRNDIQLFRDGLSVVAEVINEIKTHPRVTREHESIYICKKKHVEGTPKIVKNVYTWLAFPPRKQHIKYI